MVYNLRSRARAGSAPQPVTPGSAAVPGAYRTSVTPTVDSLSAAMTTLRLEDSSSERTSSGAVPRLLYSDAVASRTPSPRPGPGEATPVSHLADVSMANSDSPVQSTEVSSDAPAEHSTSVDDNDDGRWIPVTRRRDRGSPPRGRPTQTTHHVDGGRRAPVPDGRPKPSHHPNPQAVGGSKPVDRHDSHQRPRPPSQPSIEVGPSSKDKGKTIDPHEWGAAQIPPNELDVEAQHRELAMYAGRNPFNEMLQDPDLDDNARMMLTSYWNQLKASKASQSVSDPVPDAMASISTANAQQRGVQFTSPPTEVIPKPSKVKKETSSIRTEVVYAPAETIVDNVLLSVGNGKKGKASRSAKLGTSPPSADPKDASVPAGQIGPDSYLGFALNDASKHPKLSPPSREEDNTGPSTVHPSSGPPSSSSDSSDSGNDSSGMEKPKHKKHKKSKRPAWKPIPPTPYDGRADPEVFHRFVRQITEMINGYDIPRDMIPSTVANFLNGRAYDFYANTVAENPRQWTKLRDFFIGLFNYCFPMDFRLQIRAKLDKFHQYEKTVRDYAHGLRSLLRLAGHSVDDQESVMRLWNGLNRSIQESLWDHKLSPLVNTWDEVLRDAEFIEASRRVKESMRERNNQPRGGGSSGGDRNHRNQGGNSGSHSRPGRGRFNGPRQSNGSGSSRSAGPSNSHYRTRDHDAPTASQNARNGGQNRQQRSQPPSKLSEQRKSELHAAGKCFICEETGHFSRNCPNGNRVRSNHKGKPPGTASFNVEPDFGGIEDLRRLAESVSTPESLVNLNSIDISICSDSGSETEVEQLIDCSTCNPHQLANCSTSNPPCEPPLVHPLLGELSEVDRSELYDSIVIKLSGTETAPDEEDDAFFTPPDLSHYYSALWDRFGISAPLRYARDNRKRLSTLGDIYADRAMEVLRDNGPYCCGPFGMAGTPLIYGDFCVYCVSDTQYVIMHEDVPTDILVDSSLLQDPTFDLPQWYRYQLMDGKLKHRKRRCCRNRKREAMGYVPQLISERKLSQQLSLLGNNAPPAAKSEGRIVFQRMIDTGLLFFDVYLDADVIFAEHLLYNPKFDFWNAYSTVIYRDIFLKAQPKFELDDLEGELLFWLTQIYKSDDVCVLSDDSFTLELNGVEPSVQDTSFSSLQRNASTPRDFRRSIPEPLVVIVNINNQPARALLDSGSLSDFISAKLVHQLRLKTFELAKPLPLQLAVQGSRAKINLGCKAPISYQSVKEQRYFDVINLLNYDLILGTPFLFQHRVTMGLNPSTVVIGSSEALPIKGKQVRVIESQVAEILEDKLEQARLLLKDYAAPICREASDAPLPPLRAINHSIPLKDPSKVYSWRPSKCPDAHRTSWCEKRDAYLKSGRWKMTSARNTSPMMLLTKPGTGTNGVAARLRVVADLRERNANTIKLTSPLPDMEGILRRVSRKRYRSLIDGKDAYEHIRVIPEHIERTAMTTPDGNMVSLVMQQGDCNAVATYQTLMNHIFGPYIGVFMDVYLDDIVIYSDTLEEHIKHCKMVIDILKREKLYLSATKLHFLASEMKILGRIVDDHGIRMDPHKVDSVVNWKTPTNKELLRGFLGSVGYLADDIATIRIPMGVLSSLTGSTALFKWEPTHQRAFDEIKHLVHTHREHHRVPLDYSKEAPPIWLVTDGSIGGIAGVILQGETWKEGRIAAFFSAKLTSAQANYPVHEIEMLAGVEAMLRHRDILLGCSFTWVTDHKGLTHLLRQRNLSGRQARWLEKISEYDFRVEYLPGVENVLADALSRIYSHDPPGTVRASTEYTQHDDAETLPTLLESLSISQPVVVGVEALAIQPRLTRSQARAATLGVNPTVGDQAPKAGQPQPAETLSPLPAQTRPLTNTKLATTSKPRGRPRKQVSPQSPAVKQTLPRQKRVPIAPAETGRPETAKEFAKRIKRVVLHVPTAERQEGEGPRDPSTTASSDMATNGSLHTSDNPDTQNYDTAEDGEHFFSYVSSSSDGIDMIKAVKGRFHEDVFFKAILDNPKYYKNFMVIGKTDLILIREHDKHLLCIPDIQVNGRSAREIVILHAHSLLAHLGAYKTLGLLRDHVWWKTMTKDVQTYCDSCMTCKRSKPNNQRPYGLLHSLSVPHTPWEAIGIDFVGPLPESRNRDSSFDSVTVIIDHLTCMVHLVPSRINYTAKQVAELVFTEVYKHHGLPARIVSDRDVIFTSLFWSHLHKLMGTELRLSSAYHPESDGATERANRTVTQMLRQCIGTTQKDWVSKLPAIEFAINSARSDSTGYAPFFLNTGRMPRVMIWNNPSKEEYPAVRAYAQKIKYAIMAAHDSLIAARVKQTRDANRHRRPAPFTKGDLVYISTKNMSLPKGLARKLIPKFIGPYKILKDFKNNSYQLELSPPMKRRGIHDVFHSSLLRIHEPNDDRLFPGRLDSQVAEFEQQEIQEEWAIDRITSHAGSGTDAVFETVWKSGDVTWIPYATVASLGVLSTYLELMGVETISELKEGTGKPPTEDLQVFLGMVEMLPLGIKSEQQQNGGRVCLTSPAVLSRSRNTHSHSYSSFLYLLLTLLLLNTMTSAIPHSRAQRLDKLNAITLGSADNSLDTVVFSYGQLNLILKRDRRIRAGLGHDELAPAAYEEFRLRWNSDLDSPFSVVTLDASTGALTGDTKPPIPFRTLVPKEHDGSQEHSKMAESFAFIIAKQAARNEERSRFHKQNRLEAKNFTTKRNGGRIHPYAKRPVPAASSSTNSVSAIASTSTASTSNLLTQPNTPIIGSLNVTATHSSLYDDSLTNFFEGSSSGFNEASGSGLGPMDNLDLVDVDEDMPEEAGLGEGEGVEKSVEGNGKAAMRE